MELSDDPTLSVLLPEIETSVIPETEPPVQEEPPIDNPGVSSIPSQPETTPLPELPEPLLPQEEPVPTQPESVVSTSSPTDAAVRQQLDEFAASRQLPEFKAEFLSENDIIIPSLTNPPIPLAQVIITFLYVVPVFFLVLVL